MKKPIYFGSNPITKIPSYDSRFRFKRLSNSGTDYNYIYNYIIIGHRMTEVLSLLYEDTGTEYTI